MPASPVTDPSRPAPTQAEWFGLQARDAFEAGTRALAAGAWSEAVQWLSRAHRLAPDDLAGTLGLASALLQAGDDAAVALFTAVAERADLREAWIGLAAAHRAAGRDGAAAAALAAGLSRCVMAPGRAGDALFSAIAAAAGAPGWCCIGDGFVLRHHGADQRAPVVRADGAMMSGPILPRGAGQIEVMLDGAGLLGSPLALGRMRRVEGFVQVASDGGLEGWAWHPAAPESGPSLVVSAGAGRRITVRPQSEGKTTGGLARPRPFKLSRADLAGMDDVLRVTACDGSALLGSPLCVGALSDAPGQFIAPERVSRPALAKRPQGVPTPTPMSRPVAVVVAVFRDEALTLASLDSIETTAPPGTVTIVVDDATPEPALAAALDARQADGRIRLVRHRRNRGFPASANAGMRAALALHGGRDVLLLNSDARVTSSAIARLREAVHAHPDIGTATPLSNDASVLSYPHPDAPGPMPSEAASRRIARMAACANRDAVVDLPTAVGFCMYIRRECLEATGPFREDVFAQGYGEENDFCARASRLGWRHVAVPGAYVAHRGGASFGSARTHLMARNLAVLERLHPGYHADVARFVAADPLAPARLRIDRLRFAAGRASGGAVVLVTHDDGGGVERVVRSRCAAIRDQGRRPILLRPVIDRDATGVEGERRYRPGLCAISDDTAEPYPNLRLAIPEDWDTLLGLLRRERPAWVEHHHMLGHHPGLLGLADALSVPSDVHVHDYAAFCPRIALVGASGRYCGEPVDAAICDDCVAHAGARIEEAIPVAALRARSADHLGQARRVLVPSADTAARIRRHFPHVRPEVSPHEDDASRLGGPAAAAAQRAGDRVVCVIGGIGVEKGYDVLLACARDAAQRALPLAFRVVGHTRDDAALFDTGRVFVTGAYREAEAEDLVRAQEADLGFLPSIWPETWCFTLGLAWRAGLDVVAFDIGAQAERIRRTRRGHLLPLGLQPVSINNALLAVRAPSGDVWPEAPADPGKSQVPIPPKRVRA